MGDEIKLPLEINVDNDHCNLSIFLPKIKVLTNTVQAAAIDRIFYLACLGKAHASEFR